MVWTDHIELAISWLSIYNSTHGVICVFDHSSGSQVRFNEIYDMNEQKSVYLITCFTILVRLYFGKK